MKKRVLSLFLCFVLCISMVPTAILTEEASAEEMQGSSISEEAQTEEMNGLSTAQDIEDVQSSDNDEQDDADMQADNASVICTAELVAAEAAVGGIVQDSGE